MRRIWLFPAIRWKALMSWVGCLLKGKQPTQLIVELNLSLRHIIVIFELKIQDYNFDLPLIPFCIAPILVSSLNSRFQFVFLQKFFPARALENYDMMNLYEGRKHSLLICTLCCISLRSLACLWNKITTLQKVRMREGSHSH